ncbi:MAG: hypothetical protein COB83_05785 [Gammaproteobacteria bacterium]|nr:MAG: hypothetical protein COB83_05785 [Gammaproteobacteria bacterium]
MDYNWLQQIVDDDDLDLLKIKSTSGKPTADEHLLNGFEGINDFVANYGRHPEANMADIIEYQLFSRLDSIKNNAEHTLALEQYDIHGLLK